MPKLIESVKSIEYVSSLQRSEIVELVGEPNSGVIGGFFSKSK
ncbi:MAG: hypothetical protein ACJ71P_02120 [Nitrososphaeraceae archaeon]